MFKASGMDNLNLSHPSHSTVSWDFSDLRLAPGHSFDLQHPKLKKHFRVQYIGALEGRSLLTTRPQAMSDEWLGSTDTFVLRGLSNTHVFAIKCRPLTLSATPYPHIHFEYPKLVMAKQARSHQRVKVILPMEIKLEEDSLHLGMLTDISLTGAGVTSQEPLGDKGGSVKVVIPIILEKHTQQISLEAVIAWCSADDKGGYRYGLTFLNIADDDDLLLLAFIGHLASAQTS